MAGRASGAGGRKGPGRVSPTAPPRSFIWTRRVVLTLLTIFAATPLLVMVSSSLKPLQDVSDRFRWIPSSLTISPYVDIWSTVPLADYFLNSLIVAGAATGCSVVIATFAAYAVSRYRFRGKRLFTVTILSTQMFPGILFLLPLFLIFVNLGNATGVALYGSRGALIVTYLTFTLPFSIWMLIGYFDSIPRDLDEAALTDGCGPLGALVRVVVPAAVPGIVAVAVYSFMTAWGEVLFASVMTNETTRTLAIGLQGYATQTQVYWNQVMAASLVASVPIVAGFLLLQRYLVTGLTAGAVK
ncbi:ABC transporter permease [Streptomyces abyssalis]|uniref:ABC transporter permease n=1 Tax=Streptomyces abyssalis TaxID=933944 RepID=A0A1E7JTG9_9ACTN|nr:ABC transporter permease [Streptomyces abyssalis]OEU94365.1 ABC transporter permease [Streptomyces abyssalis]OEV28201.1 ABC transporter permease [Streptomyces nanshensis]